MSTTLAWCQIKTNSFKVEFGVVFSDNSKNKIEPYSYVIDNYDTHFKDDVTSFDLKLVKSTKMNFLDLVGGVIYTIGGDLSSNTKKKNSDFIYGQMNGGGVYAGARASHKKKHWGLTAEVCIGLLTYKDYLAVNKVEEDPKYTEFKTLSSGGLGSITSFGFYLEFGHFGVHPGYSLIFSGGSNGSFVLPSFRIPVTYSF
ncbi:MAG: hypothetical protein ACPG6V_08235 [Flavobacteriales bacterium]